VKSTCDCTNGKLTATVSVTGDTANLQRVRVLVDGNAVGELTAPSWSMNGDRPGAYTFQADGSGDDQYMFTQSSIRVDACPPPSKVAQTCSIKLTHVEGKKGYDFLIDASGTTSGSPNVPATTVVQLYGPTGAAIGEPVSLSITTPSTKPAWWCWTWCIASRRRRPTIWRFAGTARRVSVDRARRKLTESPASCA